MAYHNEKEFDPDLVDKDAIEDKQLDEVDISLLKTYGVGPYTKRIKATEDSIQAVLKRVQKVVGIKESDTGLAAPSLWDLVADRQMLNEPSLHVARCTTIFDTDTIHPKYVISLEHQGRYVVDLGENVSPTDIEEGMRVGVERQKFKIEIPLPPKIDGSVTMMQVEEKPDVTYADVGGQKEQLEKLREVVELPLLHPERFVKLGIDPPKGVLLYGPPGTGKCLARGTPVLMMDGSWKRVEDVRTGDRLMGDDSTSRNVVSVTVGREAMAQIANVDGEELFRCNMSHILSLKTGELSQVRSTRARAFRAVWCEKVCGDDDDDVVVSIREMSKQFASRDAAVAFLHKKRSAASAYLSAGDLVDISVRDYLALDKSVRRKLEGYAAPQLWFEHGMTLAELCVDPYEIGAAAKLIPAEYKTASVDARLRLLAGVIDAVGRVDASSSSSVTLRLASATVRDDIAFVARSLGLRIRRCNSSIVIDGNGIERVPTLCHKLVAPVSAASSFEIIVEKLPVGDYFGFALDGNHRFVAGKCMTVTHNTLVARAVANRTDSTFIRAIGSELVQKYVGEGARLVRELFELARSKKACVIFFDEIDAIGGTRFADEGTGESEVQRTMLELITQLDGFDPRGNVKVLMATNRPDTLDPALMRPGRLDRKIEFGLPDLEGRAHIFSIHCKTMSCERHIRIELLARLTPNATGADIRSVCTEAGMWAIRARRKVVSEADFLLAINKVVKDTKFSATATYMQHN